MAAVTTLNMGLLDDLLRKRLPRIRSKSPNFERCGTHLWTCTGTMWAPRARPCGERTDRSGTTRGAGRMGSPDHSEQFWLLTPRRLKFCRSRTRSQQAARSQTGGLCLHCGTRASGRGSILPRSVGCEHTALGTQHLGSALVAQGFLSCGSQAQQQQLRGSRAQGMWGLPGPGLEPVSPAWL